MKIDPIHPPSWKPARGYTNAVRVEGAGKLLFLAGQIAWDADQRLVGRGDIVAQFETALRNVAELVRVAGGEPAHLVRMTIYVTDKQLYLAQAKEIGARWRAVLGKVYPAMALVQVADLLEDGALVEIEATAVLP